MQAAIIYSDKIRYLNLVRTIVLGGIPLNFGNWKNNDRGFNGIVVNIEILEGKIIQNLPLNISGNSP